MNTLRLDECSSDFANREAKPAMNNFEIHSVHESDYDFILRVNEENVEVLSPMDRDGLLRFAEMAEMFSVATVNGQRAAFLIALTEAASSYESENYRWFKNRYEHFLYVDRIVIDEPFRKIGLGTALYQNVFHYAMLHNIPVVTAEIDTIPYNDASLKFHRRMGFEEVGTQYVRNGQIQVSLQMVKVR